MLVGNLLGLGFTYAIQGLCALTPDAESVSSSPGLLPFGWFAITVVAGAMCCVFNFNGQYLRLEADQAGAPDRLLAVAVEHATPQPSPASDTLQVNVNGGFPPGSGLASTVGSIASSPDPYPVGARSPAGVAPITPPPPPELR